MQNVIYAHVRKLSLTLSVVDNKRQFVRWKFPQTKLRYLEYIPTVFVGGKKIAK